MIEKVFSSVITCKSIHRKHMMEYLSNAGLKEKEDYIFRQNGMFDLYFFHSPSEAIAFRLAVPE